MSSSLNNSNRNTTFPPSLRPVRHGIADLENFAWQKGTSRHTTQRFSFHDAASQVGVHDFGVSPSVSWAVPSNLTSPMSLPNSVGVFALIQ